MTLPLNYQITVDIAWIAVIFLFFTYLRRKSKDSGQYDFKCKICSRDVRKIKENNKRWFKITAHDRFTWSNPLAFYQVFHFCSMEHLYQWIQTRLPSNIEKQKVIEEYNKNSTVSEYS